jgi:hypothetical protein
MIKHLTLTITDHGDDYHNVPLDYLADLYAPARYAIHSKGSLTVMWTNEPKAVEEYAIQFARQITNQQQHP